MGSKTLNTIGPTSGGHARCGWIEGGYRYSMENGKKVAEHRAVMEKELGRPLLSNEVVHHHDGDKLNNSVENLTVWSSPALVDIC